MEVIAKKILNYHDFCKTEKALTQHSVYRGVPLRLTFVDARFNTVATGGCHRPLEWHRKAHPEGVSILS